MKTRKGFAGKTFGYRRCVGEPFRLKRKWYVVAKCLGCGNDHVRQLGYVVHGVVQKCKGCTARVTQTTHGMHKSPEYSVWTGMINRCHNANSDTHLKYGARGIFVCPRWRGVDGFSNFLSDMGPRPTAKHQIDRTDNNGPYSPENCRWVTSAQNARNKRNTRMLTIGGTVMSMADWADQPGAVSYRQIRNRIQLGWSHEDAVFRPLRVWDQVHTERTVRSGNRD